MSQTLLESVRCAIVTNQLLPPRARIMVGVSGGADSVTLLHVLRRLQSDWHWTLHVAHVDHGVRAASSRDAAFVRDLSVQLGLACTSERVDVRAACAREGWSLEDGARRVRYECLRDLAQRHSASHVVVAHTADDQAETVLMRLMRGTGSTGLGGMPVARRLDGSSSIWLVRPMLDVWRHDVMAYVHAHHLSHAEDETNRELRFLRNRIRHELLPLLERQYNANVKERLVQLAQQSQADADYLQAEAQRHWKATIRPTGSARLSMAVRRWQQLPTAMQRQLARLMFERLRVEPGQLEFRHWLHIERLCTELPVGAVVDLPGGVRVRRDTADRIIWERATRARVRAPAETAEPVLAPQ